MVVVIIVFGHECDGEGIYLAATIDPGNEPRQLLPFLNHLMYNTLMTPVPTMAQKKHSCSYSST